MRNPDKRHHVQDRHDEQHAGQQILINFRIRHTFTLALLFIARSTLTERQSAGYSPIGLTGMISLACVLAFVCDLGVDSGKRIRECVSPFNQLVNVCILERLLK